jgi:hypothetical protein
MVMYGWVGASGAAFGLTSPRLWELEVKFAAMSAGPRIKLSVPLKSDFTGNPTTGGEGRFVHPALLPSVTTSPRSITQDP